MAQRTEVLTIRISPQLKQRLQLAAEADGRTMSQFAVRLIQAATDQVVGVARSQ